eukprot:15461331-Alexandrium_andersonii.AAC.4
MACVDKVLQDFVHVPAVLPWYAPSASQATLAFLRAMWRNTDIGRSDPCIPCAAHRGVRPTRA